jgi:hypothetical protein
LDVECDLKLDRSMTDALMPKTLGNHGKITLGCGPGLGKPRISVVLGVFVILEVSGQTPEGPTEQRMVHQESYRLSV